MELELVNLLKKDYSLKDIPACYGRNKKLSKVKIYKAYFMRSCIFICNDFFSEKEKVRFVNQLFSWFYKNPIAFNLIPFLKNKKKCKIENNDFINICCSLNYASLKKFLNIFSLKMLEKKKIKIKERRYSIIITLYFLDINNSSKDIILDISCEKHSIIKVFIIINSYFIKDVLQLLFFYYNNLNMY